MDKIAYFRLQAKNLMRDFRTQTLDEEGLTQYSPKFFDDIDDILLSYNVDEKNFTLMKAQHLIANLAGFDKWADLLHASDAALELGEILLNKRLAADWQMYLWMNRIQNLSDSDKLTIFKAIYLHEFSDGKRFDEEEPSKLDEPLEYEDYGYDKELADYFRSLDKLTDEIEQRYYT